MNLSNDAETPAFLQKKTDTSFSNPLALLSFVIFAAIFIGARLWRLTASCLWFDEIFSVHAARHSWAGMVHFVAADIIHPPLFYALLKLWINLGGESLLWLRLFPALTGIVTIVPFYLLAHELRLKSAEINLALLLMAVNGFLVKYAQELRMYSLLLFLTLCSLWFFVRFLKTETVSRKQLLGLFAINLLLVYAHYAGWLVVGLQTSVLIICKRNKIRAFLATSAALVLAYIPWIGAVINAGSHGKGWGQNIGWVTRPNPLDVAEYFALLNKPFLFRQSSAEAPYDLFSTFLAVMLLGLPLLALAWHVFRLGPGDDKRRIQGLFVLSFAPVPVVFLLSWLLPYSVWGTRHLIIAAGPYSILAALALERLRPNWMRVSVLVILGCWFTLAGALFALRSPPTFIWCAWEELAQQMMVVESDSSQIVPVYAYEDLVAYHLWYTLDTARHAKFKLTVLKGVAGMFDDPAYFLPRDFAEIAVRESQSLEGDHIWVAFRGTQWDETRPPLNGAKTAGYRIGRVLATRAQGQEAFLVELSKDLAN